MDPNLTISGLLRAVTWGGSTVLVVGGLSKYGDVWPWFQKLESGHKRIVMYAISAFLSLGTWAALKYVPDATWVALQEPFAVLVTVAGGIMGNQAIYYVKNRLNPTVEKVDEIKEEQTVEKVQRIEEAGMIVATGHDRRP